MTCIATENIEVDEHVCGFLISVTDIEALSKIIAVIAMGQADHAARIVCELEPNTPAFTLPQLCQSARDQLTVKGNTANQLKVSRYQRDGFLFECISWITARLNSNQPVIMKAPHIKATTQGLDGLVIELSPDGSSIARATILEDKCTGKPRDRFRDEVLEGFKKYHNGDRSPELVAAASDLLKQANLNGTAATQAAARVLNNSYRAYKASLTTPDSIDTAKKRSDLFKGYSDLEDLRPEQREGCMLQLPRGELRNWFQELANSTIQAIAIFEDTNV